MLCSANRPSPGSVVQRVAMSQVLVMVAGCAVLCAVLSLAACRPVTPTAPPTPTPLCTKPEWTVLAFPPQGEGCLPMQTAAFYEPAQGSCDGKPCLHVEAGSRLYFGLKDPSLCPLREWSVAATTDAARSLGAFLGWPESEQPITTTSESQVAYQTVPSASGMLNVAFQCPDTEAPQVFGIRIQPCPQITQSVGLDVRGPDGLLVEISGEGFAPDCTVCLSQEPGVRVCATPAWQDPSHVEAMFDQEAKSKLNLGGAAELALTNRSGITARFPMRRLVSEACPPKVSHFEPMEASAGGRLSLSIYGECFLKGCYVSFLIGQTQELTVTARFTGSTVIGAELVCPNVESDTPVYFKVSNLDGKSGVSPDALRIRPKPAPTRGPTVLPPASPPEIVCKPGPRYQAFALEWAWRVPLNDNLRFDLHLWRASDSERTWDYLAVPTYPIGGALRNGLYHCCVRVIEVDALGNFSQQVTAFGKTCDIEWRGCKIGLRDGNYREDDKVDSGDLQDWTRDWSLYNACVQAQPDEQQQCYSRYSRLDLNGDGQINRDDERIIREHKDKPEWNCGW